MQIVETNRLVVENITIKDASFFVSLVNSPGWIKFIGDRNIKNEHNAIQYLERGYLQSYVDNGFGYYIFKVKPSGQPVGICGFLKKPTLDNPDFGFAIHPDFYGQGYAFEASQAVMAYGIETFNFDVLDAVTKPNNRASIKLLKKLEFHPTLGPNSNTTAADLLLFRWKRGV